MFEDRGLRLTLFLTRRAGLKIGMSAPSGYALAVYQFRDRTGTPCTLFLASLTLATGASSPEVLAAKIGRLPLILETLPVGTCEKKLGKRLRRSHLVFLLRLPAWSETAVSPKTSKPDHKAINGSP